MDEAPQRIVVDRVAQAELSDDVGLLVLAARKGRDQLDAVLGSNPRSDASPSPAIDRGFAT